MQNNKVNILSTMPVGDILIGEAAQNDITIQEVPFIDTIEINDSETERRINELAHQKITAVFTSRKAVDAVSKSLPSDEAQWEIFVPVTQQKRAKEIFGDENIFGTAGNAELLAKKIVDYPGVKSIIFFCGDQRRDELPAILTNNGITVEEVVVYKTIETSRLVSTQYDGILFFSPSAVKSFFPKNSVSSKTQFFAIGATTANAIYAITPQGSVIANEAGKENLVKLAIEHFTKK